MMKPLEFAAIAGMLVVTVPTLSAPNEQGQGQAVVTVLAKGNREVAPSVQLQDLQVRINGKLSTAMGWEALRGDRGRLELVILIDGGTRSSLGMQISEMQKFVEEMPAHARMAFAYMENGRAAFSGPFSSDPAEVLKEWRLPMGSVGQSASPYFCLSDLAKNWPSRDRAARREVVMITDGVDLYSPRYDPDDPYVQAAIADSVRAGLVVYSIYWENKGRLDQSSYAVNAGQSLLLQVADATGGASYWQGIGNPVSFEPFFKDLRVRLENQYRLNFSTELKGGAGVQGMKLKVGGPASAVTAPQRVFVAPAGAVAGE